MAKLSPIIVELKIPHNAPRPLRLSVTLKILDGENEVSIPIQLKETEDGIALIEETA